jgi:biopolymer transport protein ExbD
MAGIDTGGGGHGGRRSVNQELPLVPFIDFLLCLVMFLLVTAVWSQMSRLNADAQVPGPPNPEKDIEEQKKEKTLHVEMKGDRKFDLVWKEGTTVVNTIEVARKQVPFGEGEYTYPDLAKKVDDEWKQNGSHRAATDKKFDQAILHTDNTTPFADIVAVIDAIYTPKRQFKLGNQQEDVPAFNITFSVN